MRKFLFALVAVVCAISASAQRASDSSAFSLWNSESVDQSIVLGVRAGMNVSNLGGDADMDSKIGFKAGISADFPIVSSFYINSGLFYSMKGAKADEATITSGYIELPIYASYRMNFSEASQLQLNFGPYLAYGVNGKFKVEDEKFDLFGTDEDQAGFKRFDAGLGIGLGYTISKFYIGFEYQFGLVNCLDDDTWDGANAKNNNFNISIGYNF